MQLRYILLSIFFMVMMATTSINAQLISYSETDREDARDVSFEIIGKYTGNIHIYKGFRDVHSISIYDAQMKLTSKNKITFLPERVINVDFLAYSNYYYMFYQYQKRGILFCMAAKFSADGNPIGNAMVLDTTNINFNVSNKIYTIINSEDKQKIMVIKINKPNEKQQIVSSILFNKDLIQLEKSELNLPMQERFGTLSEFAIDNTGDLVFLKAYGSGQSDIVNKLMLVTKKIETKTYALSEINIGPIFLDDIRLKIDNVNTNYLLTCFYAKQRRGNIDGLLCYIYDKNLGKEKVNTKIVFDDEFRTDAKGENNIKSALNDYYLRQIIVKKDGGFALTAEATYNSQRGNSDPFNRWDNFGGGYGNSFGFNNGFNNYNVYGLNSMWGNPFNRGVGNITRYYSDNIMMLSFDNTGKLEWSNIIRKSQFDDNTENFLGYGLLNTGDQIHFLFNVQEKRQTIFTNQSISTDGQIVRNPTLKNLDRGVDFMAKFAKQTGSRQVIVPCMLRNYLCFAKIDF